MAAKHRTCKICQKKLNGYNTSIYCHACQIKIIEQTIDPVCEFRLPSPVEVGKCAVRPSIVNINRTIYNEYGLYWPQMV